MTTVTDQAGPLTAPTRPPDQARSVRWRVCVNWHEQTTERGSRALLHHVDPTRLRATYRAISPTAALGRAELAGPTDCAVARNDK